MDLTKHRMTALQKPTRFTSAKKLVYKFWTIMLLCEASTGSNPLG